MPRIRKARKAKAGVKRPRKGRGFSDVLKGLHNFVKDNKLISQLAVPLLSQSKLGSKHPNALGVSGALASSLGYGRKRRVKHGKGFFDDFLSGFLPVIKAGLPIVASLAGPEGTALGALGSAGIGALGYGKRKHRGRAGLASPYGSGIQPAHWPLNQKAGKRGKGLSVYNNPNASSTWSNPVKF